MYFRFCSQIELTPTLYVLFVPIHIAYPQNIKHLQLAFLRAHSHTMQWVAFFDCITTAKTVQNPCYPIGTLLECSAKKKYSKLHCTLKCAQMHVDARKCTATQRSAHKSPKKTEVQAQEKCIANACKNTGHSRITALMQKCTVNVQFLVCIGPWMVHSGLFSREKS